MKQIVLSLMMAWSLFSVTAAEGEPLRASTTGFYPLWENTGHIERHREVFLGTTGAQVGILDRLHLGVEPIQFLYRTPNLYAKVSLYDDGPWHVAGQVGALYLMERAGRASLSPMYTSRLDNFDYSVCLIPATLAVSHQIGDWLELHHGLTALGLMTGGPLQDEVTFGYALEAELNPLGRHAAILHAAEVGLWRHDHAILGASYRYRNTWLELRLGYFYRLRAAGTQGGPLIGLGLLL
jgi:hypothetical protein